MVTINPLDIALWTFRRNEKDVVHLYDSLSPIMQMATDNSMLNFGYWDDQNKTPQEAQSHLCYFFGQLAELDHADLALDVGSGLSGPAKLWKKKYGSLGISCVNINKNQLIQAKENELDFVNASSTRLPFDNNSVDRVLALESSQHFKPFSEFLSESKRVLKNSGFLLIALPIVNSKTSIRDLGLLKFTWSSEHYTLNFVKNSLKSEGFFIEKEQLIGSSVYEPLAEFYLENRGDLQKKICQKYPKIVENILHRSLLKMQEASRKKIIDYFVVKCSL